jgi:GDP-mannose 6-dehydrogenase
MKKISIFGLGYVGAVSAGCLANDGHTVIGIDQNHTKVELVNNGRSPIIEKDLSELIHKGVATGRLSATTDFKYGVLATELSLICVGTPSQLNGNLDLGCVRQVCEEIGRVLRDKEDFHIVACRSTMLPGSMRNVVIPTLEQYSGKRACKDFGVCNNPEFLREGTAVHDFYNPPKTVIGATDSRSRNILTSLYENLRASLIQTDVETAEMVKFTDNVWHATKVCFANEIGTICKKLGIDSHKVMDIFCEDTKLNLSPYYMKPGFAFGGSCLPKDVHALVYKGRSLDLDVPLINAILPSNERQIARGLQMIMDKGNKKIGVLGLSFKAGTDDLRGSPLVEIIERLLGKGYNVRVYDRNVNLAKLVGANRNYILNHIPHISRIMVETADEILAHAETLVFGNRSSEFAELVGRTTETQAIVDLVRVSSRLSSNGKYDGICW